MASPELPCCHIAYFFPPLILIANNPLFSTIADTAGTLMATICSKFKLPTLHLVVHDLQLDERDYPGKFLHFIYDARKTAMARCDHMGVVLADEPFQQVTPNTFLVGFLKHSVSVPGKVFLWDRRCLNDFKRMYLSCICL